MDPEKPSPDKRAKRVWSLGSYSDIAPYFLGMAAHLVKSTDVDANDNYLTSDAGRGTLLSLLLVAEPTLRGWTSSRPCLRKHV